MRAVTFLVLFLLATVAPLWGQNALEFPPEETPIASVKVTGLETVPDSEILRVMELQQGGKFSRAAYRNDLQAIANTGKVDPLSVKIVWERNDARELLLTVQARENPTVSRIDIAGSLKYTETELKNELGFKEGDILPTGARASIVRNLRSFYREAGFKSARISVDVRPGDGEGKAAIFITVDEGTRIKIKDLDLRGNTYLHPLTVQLRLLNTPGFFVFNNYFDEMAMEQDLAILRQLYEDGGYLDAKVKLGELEYRQDKNEVKIYIDVEQGPRYDIASVSYQGVTYFRKDELDEITQTLVGKTYKGKRLAEVLDEIRALYGNLGYIDTQVGNRLLKNRAEETVEVVIVVDEAPISYIGSIRVQMEDFDYEVDVNIFDTFMDWFAPPLKEEAVQREIRLRTGEKYRLKDERRTERRLRALGILKDVNIRRIPTSDPAVKDVVIEVSEDPASAYVGATGGYGQYSGAAVTLEFMQPNWGGNADRVRASATFGTRSTAYRIGYFDRYIGSTDTSMDLSAYRTLDRLRAYDQRTYGGEVEFSRPLDEDLRGYLSFRLERVDFRDYSDSAVTDLDGYGVIAFRPGIEYDQRDDIFWPTRGYRVGGGVEVGYADGAMVKFLHNYGWYHNLYRERWVYAYEHGVSLMPMKADEIGLSERFFVGGSNSLRGFRWKEVGPRDKGDEKLAIGGATRITQRHELRYSVTDNIRLRGFTDAAILEEGILDLGTPRIGSGGGVSVDIGPLRVDVDLAAPLLREDTDEPQYLHLRVGSRF